MVRVYAQNIVAEGEQVITVIIKIIVMRIQKEVNLIASVNSLVKTNLIINKCWNIIKIIADYEFFIPKFLPIIEKQLLPLFEYIKHIDKIEFDEEIILVVTSFIRLSKNITPAMEKIFPFYQDIFKKNQNLLGHLF